jgi:hypothetical protein
VTKQDQGAADVQASAAPARKPINSRDKGLTAERHLANWLVAQGWPDARRSVATGWETKGRKQQDQGDIAGTPGLCFQLKNVARTPDEGSELKGWFADTEAQAGPDRMPLLVVKRAGFSKPHDWWVWVRADWLVDITVGIPHELVPERWWSRVQLGRLSTRLLRYSRTRQEEGSR